MLSSPSRFRSPVQLSLSPPFGEGSAGDPVSNQSILPHPTSVSRLSECWWVIAADYFFLITPSGQSQPHSSPSIRAAHRPRQHWGANKIKKDALSLRLLVPVLDEMDEEMRTNTRSVIFLSLAWLTHSCNVRYDRWILKSAFLMFSFMRLARWLLALLYSIASLISFLYSRCN